MSLWLKACAALKQVAGSTDRTNESSEACNHGRVPHPPGTAEFELFVAESELKAGHLTHGARHLAELISGHPTRPEGLELLQKYLHRVEGDESRLYPPEEKRYFAFEVVRAYVWGMKGRWNDAVNLLLQLTEANSNSTYLEDWALNWLEQDEALAAIAPLTLKQLLAQVVNRFPEYRWLRRSDQTRLERYVGIALRAPAPVRASATFQMMHAGLLRKLGRFDEALVVTRDSAAASAGWHAQVAQGLVLREQGNYEEAAAAFERAIAFDPDDLSARLEAADGYLLYRVWDKAYAGYSEVLKRQPDHPWALPSALFCRWKSSGDELKRKRLIEMARKIPENRRAAQLLGVNDPYIGILPLPADAIANAIPRIVGSIQTSPGKEPGGEIGITVNYLESPSAAMALAAQIKALGRSIPIVIDVKAIPQPDPRQPCCPTQQSLWMYNGYEAQPALPAPPPAILEKVAELAGHPYERDENWRDAKLIARQLTEDQIPHLLAAMVHPPAIPQGGDGREWILRVQLAAAQVIAHIGNGWQNSPRRNALLSVLFGPRDWATVAAIVTLAHLAEENPELESDIHEAFTTLTGFIPDGGYCCFAQALFTCWQWLPHLPLETKRLLHDRLAALA